MSTVLDLLRPHAKAFGPALARAAFSRGLAVTKKEDGSRIPIPITATPFVLTDAQQAERSLTSAHLASAGLKMARAVVEGPLSELLMGGLGPLERAVVEASERALDKLVITRVDYFVSDRAWALELNATIPAMPAYSDVAAESYIETLGAHAGLEASRVKALVARNGSNSRALYDALMKGYALERNGRAPSLLAVLVRRNDAQLTEIQSLVARFNAWGTETVIVYPDEASAADANGGFQAHGKRFDFVYRHLFVRRLEEIDAPFIRDFLSHPARRGAVLFNGPAAHVETKSNFALLSQALSDGKLAEGAGLSADELDTIRRSVPWTRPLRKNPGVDPDGREVPDLVKVVADAPERFVLKRAWDYGGKAVFIGSSLDEPGFDDRVKAAYGKALTWPELVERAANDPVGGGFVVQELVRVKPEEHWVATETALTPVEMYVDYSAYASVGLGFQPGWGGVCRGSPSKIVNILGGGGVLPLLRADVWDELAAALRSK